MNSPAVSVIMPVYNGAGHLEKAIRSVLAQTVPDIELVIANDGSTDDSDAIVRSIDDPRIRYVPLERNQGADVARTRAFEASTGTWIAMLDQDDEMHPRKLEAHLEHVQRHPDDELTYNPRYDLLCSGRGIWQMFRPPEKIALADLLLGFPISPSEAILTRDLMKRTWRESADVPFHGGEILWYGRHWMSGVRFGFIDETLNYRRYHPGRRYSDIEGSCGDYLYAQNTVFDDPRCPEEVRALRPVAQAWSRIVWCCHAFAQDETELAQELLRKAIALNPAVLTGTPASLVEHFTNFSITDDTRDHEALLRKLFRNLPSEAESIAGELDWAIHQGFLIDGALAVIWNRPADARAKFDEAKRRGVEVGDWFLRLAAYHLNHFQTDAGDDAADDAALRLSSELSALGSAAAGRRLCGDLRMTRAFRDFQSGDRRHVPKNVLRAMAGEPSYTLNRGAWSILMRSVLKRSARPANSAA